MDEMENMARISSSIFSPISAAALLGLATLDAVAWIAGAAFGMGGGYKIRRMLRRTAEIGPIDVGTQVFAADSTGCYPFNCRASLCGNAPPFYPVAYDLRRQIQAIGKH